MRARNKKYSGIWVEAPPESIGEASIGGWEAINRVAIRAYRERAIKQSIALFDGIFDILGGSAAYSGFVN